MGIRANPALFAVFMACGIAGLLLALQVWHQRRSIPAARPLVILLAATSQVLLAYAMSFAPGRPAEVIWWIDFTYVGWLIAPPALLCFVASLTGRSRWTSRRALVLLSVEPVTMGAVIFGPVGQDAFFAGGRNPTTFDFVASSWAYWAFIAYANALLLIATVMAITSVRSRSRLHPRQMALVIAALLLPWVVSYFSIPNVRILGADPSVLSLIASVGLLYLLARYRILGVQPLAGLGWYGSEGVVVLDAHGRIAQISATAARLLGGRETEAMGRRAEDAWQGMPEILRALKDPSAAEVAVHPGSRSHGMVLLERSPVSDASGAVLGTLVVVRGLPATAAS